MKNVFALIITSFLLTGCVPTLTYITTSFMNPYNVVKTGVDVASYVATEKTATDHAISAALEKDCALVRALQENEICIQPVKDLDNKYHKELNDRINSGR